MSIDTRTLTPKATVLDVISRYRRTEGVFRQYDKIAGECICCKALFESLEDVAEKYGLDPEKFLSDLEDAINIR